MEDFEGERGLFGHHHENHQAYQQVYEQPHHQAKLSHELMGGAAAFAAMKMFEHKRANEGNPMSHPNAKAALAALAGFEIDKLAESRGMDDYERHRAKQHAEQQAMAMYDQKYMGGGGGFQQPQGDFGRAEGYGGPQGNFGPQGGYGQGYGGQQGGYGGPQGGYGGPQGGYGSPQGGYGGPQGGYGGGGYDGGYNQGAPQGYPGNRY